MRVAPRKAEILGQSFDRKIPSRPFSGFLYHVVVEINGMRWIEEVFDLLGTANIRILVLKLAVDRAFVF
jgi:hypothetical protein